PALLFSGSVVSISPPTSSSSCARTYERYAEELGCNNIDNYDSLVSQYKSCLDQDIAACSAAPEDPNCTG
ncbi:MAG: hypothetical protein ACQES2_12210, partial [Pseudomonadota bacterium]